MKIAGKSLSSSVDATNDEDVYDGGKDVVTRENEDAKSENE